MIRIRLARTALAALVLAFFAFATANHAPWSTERFDPFDEDSGYVELVRSGDSLHFALQVDEGTLPAEVTGDALPLDSDFDEDLLTGPDAIALYGGIAVETGVGWVVVQLEGNAKAIHEAILARLSDLRVTYQEDGMPGGPVYSYRLSDGDAHWRIAISANGEGALVHLQEMN